MSGRDVFWFLAIIIMVAAAVADFVLIDRIGKKGLGTRTISGEVLIVVSMIFQAVFLFITGLEIIMRFYLSAFGLPCHWQRREICCIEYRMTTFWKALKIESAISFPITIVIALLMFFLDITIADWKQLNIWYCAILVVVPLIQLILSCIGYNLCVKEFYEQYPDELPMAETSDSEDTLGAVEMSGASSAPVTPAMLSPTTPMSPSIASLGNRRKSMVTVNIPA